MSSFNVFAQKKKAGEGSVPVWLGTVSPRPVGGTLAAAFCKAGMYIPAGTPICFDEANKKITPLVLWKVKSVDSSTHTLTVYANEYYDIAPVANDILSPLGATFATTGAAGKVSAVAAGSAAGTLDITMTDAKLDGVSANSYIGYSNATDAASSGKLIKDQPNAYLYNDIAIDVLQNGESYDSIKASGAAVDFHGEGLLYKRIPYGDIAEKLKAVIPNVVLVGF